MKKKILSFAVAATLLLSGSISIASNFAQDKVVKKTTVVENKAMAKSSNKRGKGYRPPRKPAYRIPTGAEGEISFNGCYINLNTDNSVLAGLGNPDKAWIEGPYTSYDAATNTTNTYQLYCFSYTQLNGRLYMPANLQLYFVRENNGTPKFYSCTLSGKGAMYNNFTFDSPCTTSQDMEAVEGMNYNQFGAYCACQTIYSYVKSNGAIVDYEFSLNELQSVTVKNSLFADKFKR